MYMSVAVKSGQLEFSRVWVKWGSPFVARGPKRRSAPGGRRVPDYAAPKSGEDLPLWCLEDTSPAVRSPRARLFQGQVKNPVTIKQNGKIARTNIQGRTDELHTELYKMMRMQLTR